MFVHAKLGPIHALQACTYLQFGKLQTRAHFLLVVYILLKLLHSTAGRRHSNMMLWQHHLTYMF